MMDLDKKVASRVCANSKRKGEVLNLENHADPSNPYHIEIKTGCKKKTKRGHRFCTDCLSELGVKDKSTGELLFLESLHPLSLGRKGGQTGNSEKKPDGEYILVKQFGVTYKFWMKESDLPKAAKSELDK